jgi:2-haloalkanoic acid dehalogenase type II
MGGARFVSQDGDASFSKMTLQRGAGITQLTFDCYGTLIDWEQGILSAVNRLFVRGRARPTSEAILRSFVTHEARIESGEWRPYRDVLRAVLVGMAADFGLAISESETNLLSDSLPQWPPFPDTVDALRRLAKKFRLVILSNTDDSLFAQTQKRLGVRFDEVITAEQVKSYKPGKDGKGLEETDIYFIKGGISDRRRTPFPAGGLFSTARDVARFYQMALSGGTFDGKKIISKESLALMTRTQTGDIKTGFTDGMSWGFGFQVVKEPQGVTAMFAPGAFGHGGAYATQSWADPKRDLIFVLMIQRAGFPNGDSSPVRRAFQEAAVAAVKD